MMRNKRGWIRIVEAFIAVTLITAVLLSIYVKQPAPKNNDIEKIMDATLDEIVNNNHLRQDVLNNQLGNINLFVDERMPSVVNYTLKICPLNDVCNLDEYHDNMFAKERIVSSTLEEYSPMKIKLFVWEGAMGRTSAASIPDSSGDTPPPETTPGTPDECNGTNPCPSLGECKSNSCVNNHCLASNLADGSSCNTGTCQSGVCISAAATIITVSDCADLNQENAKYVLDGDIPSPANCFSLSANNVTLDCQGHSIQSSGGSGNIIYVSGAYDSVKNCVITSSDWVYAAIAVAGSSNKIMDNNININSVAFGMTIDGTNHDITGNTVNLAGSSWGIIIRGSNILYSGNTLMGAGGNLFCNGCTYRS
jgi:hypothetical protein